MAKDRKPEQGKSTHLVQKIIIGAVFLIVVVLLLMWLAGVFHQKIDRVSVNPASAVSAERPVGAARLIEVQTKIVPRVEFSVGTIRAVHEISIASKILAKATQVNATAGQQVHIGDVLVRLDDADHVARLEQAIAATDAARAKRDQAKIEFDRVQQLVEREAASKIEWDRVQSTLKAADAELLQAEQVTNELRAVLDYATLQSPIDGVIIDKKVEVGDTVTPGQALLVIYDPTRMQLVASVRESLTRHLSVGQTIGVRIDALDRLCQGRISEIVPEADAATRAFSVKVTGPCPPGIYSGMFGRILIPLEDEQVLVIPQNAVRHVGQLKLVDVTDGRTLRRRAVQIGRSFDDDVEVLSGLRAGELVAVSVVRAGASSP